MMISENEKMALYGWKFLYPTIMAIGEPKKSSSYLEYNKIALELRNKFSVAKTREECESLSQELDLAYDKYIKPFNDDNDPIEEKKFNQWAKNQSCEYKKF